MSRPTGDQALTAAVQTMAGAAASELVAEAFADARAEVKSILRRQMVDALLDETLHCVARTTGGRDSTTEYMRAPAKLGSMTAMPAPPRDVAEIAGAPGSAPERWRPSQHLGRPGAQPGRPGDGGTPAPAVQRGVYVYGFTSRSGEQYRDLRGIDDSRTYPVAEGDLVAVVSDVCGERHRWGIGANREPDLTLLAPRLEEHEGVLEAILEHGSVVPMRFGTLYTSRDAVHEVLRVHASAIGALLARIDGMAEWGLTVTWNRSLADSSPAGRDADAWPVNSATRGSPGRSYLRRRETERAKAERLAERRSGLSAELHRAIEAVAGGSVIHPSARRRDTAGGADTLLRASYLVHKADRERFEAVIVEGLEGGVDVGLQGELTGPWPPYNFANLELEGVSA